MKHFRIAEIPRICSCSEIHQFTEATAKEVYAYHSKP